MTDTKEKPTSPYTLRMADDMKEWVKHRAIRNNRSMNGELIDILEKVKEEEEKQKAA